MSAVALWSGPAGESYHNDTGKVVYQRQCAWINTCANCAEYDLMIFAQPMGALHPNCRCQDVPVFPDESARVFQAYQDTIETLPEDKQQSMVGVGVWALLEAGLITWDDLVGPAGVKSLTDVVRDKNLSIEDLVDAGVDPVIAEKAWASVHDPTAAILAEQKQELIDSIIDMLDQPTALEDIFGAEEAEEIEEEAASPQPLAPSDQSWFAKIMASASFGIKTLANQVIATIRSLVK